MPNSMDIIGAGGYAQIADDAAFDPSGDVEWRFDVFRDDWTANAETWLASRYETTGNDRQWQVEFEGTGAWIVMQVGASDGTFRATFSVGGLTIPAAGERLQIRVQLDADNGSTETEVTVYTRSGANIAALDNDDNWTNEGSATTAGAQTWKATAQPMLLGAKTAGDSNWDGGFYRYMMWTDLTKTTKVADVDFTDPTTAVTEWSEWDDAASANNWNMQGTEDTDWEYVEVGASNLLLLGVG